MNNSKTKTEMKFQAPEERIKNFDEVALGYTEEEAIEEAKRCLNCPSKPCTSGCPVNVRIPEFIHEVSEGRFVEAYKIIVSTNSLPAICGRVCPQENQCEGKCVRGAQGEPVAIGRLERFVADYIRENKIKTKQETETSGAGHKVAVVGSGPAGLSCASDLAKAGVLVTVFESLHETGGVLRYGIPEFRLPKDIVAAEIKGLEEMGVRFEKNVIIGKSYTVQDLKDRGYDAVFVGTGAGLPSFMNIPGENYLGVYSANEYLTRINLMKAYKDEYDTPIKRHGDVVIVGAGNVAMDAARCARRMGANVHIVYRRSREEMPARAEEICHAEEEGIDFNLLCNPVEIIGDENNQVKSIKCIRMELGEPDQSGRRKPVPVSGSEFEIPTEAVIMALGTKLNTLVSDTTPGIEKTEKGGINIDETTGATTAKGVFAGGDAVTGAATVIKAMGAGKKAAQGIIDYLKTL